MRIAFDAKRYFHNFTGLGRYSRELIDGLVEHYPNDEYYLCAIKSGQIPKHTTLLQPKFDQLLFTRYWRSLGVTLDLKKHHVNLFHGLSNEIPFGLRQVRIRRVVTIHDMIFLRYPEMYNRVDRWIYERKVNYAAINCDVVIATSKQTADDISFFYPVRQERLKVVYQAVSIPTVTQDEIQRVSRKYGLPDGCFLYVGRVEERKNLLGILDAMRMMNKPPHLAVVGRPHNSYYKRCNDFINKYKLQDYVRFYSDITREELAAFYHHCLALVYPSYFEGFGIPIVEAQLCNTAVITSVGGCFAETAGEAAIFVNPSESLQIAEAMEMIIQNNAIRIKLVNAGAINAKRFTREKFVDEVHAIYKQLT